MAANQGLEGIEIADTRLSLVDGENGRLIYRGHWAKELALNHSFEDVVHLLWFGHLPDENEQQAFRKKLASFAFLPDYIKNILSQLPTDIDPMSALRTGISAVGTKDYGYPPTSDQALETLAKTCSIIPFFYHQTQGTTAVEPREDYSIAENYLYMLHGKEPSEAHARALDAYLILTAEHGMNASTFSSRVATSTRADLISAVSAAISTLKGPLHGGAPSEVDDMLEAIGTKDNAEPWIRAELEKGKRLMGFGHRVYKTQDPRAEALRTIASKFAGEDPWFQLGLHVEEVAIKLLNEYKPGRALYTNVEFYAAAVLRGVAIPRPLYTPTFTLSRTAGWVANVMEQTENNRLIRPKSNYIGDKPTSPQD